MQCDCCNSSVEIRESVNLAICGFCGYAKQIKIEPHNYGIKYVEKNYRWSPVTEVSFLRLGYIASILKDDSKVLDIGYGDGEFIRALRKCGVDAIGYDVHSDSLGVPTVSDLSGKYDVVTLYDALEHVENLETILKINTEYFIVTVPNFLLNQSDDQIRNWKHYKPNEHLHYFTEASILALFRRHDFDCLLVHNVEDLIRTKNGQNANTMTYIFKRFDI